MNLREYGLGNYTRYIIGRPRVAQTITEPLEGIPPECPNCHMDHLYQIEVVLQDMPMLKKKLGLGTYLSCAACPFASPMMVVGIDQKPEWWRP